MMMLSMMRTWCWSHHPVLCPVGVLAQHRLALLDNDAAPKAAIQARPIHHNGILNIITCGML
jgi:hypothetical protein